MLALRARIVAAGLVRVTARSRAASSAAAPNPYSHTMNLPTTRFPMRADAATRELELVADVTVRAYAALSARVDAPRGDFVLHDGPPFANGALHAGHALNKVLKDIVNRYKGMRGHRVVYVPGWDCHGLPIEHKALEAARALAVKAAKAAGKGARTTAAAAAAAAAAPAGSASTSAKATSGAALESTPVRASAPAPLPASAPTSALEIRKLAREFALGAVGTQRTALERWAVMGDYAHAYRTLDASYEAAQIAAFGEMWARGLVFRGLKPVHWSPSSQTALAEAELEYDERTSVAAHVAFRLAGAQPDARVALAPDAAALAARFPDLRAIAWTTTPWTLVANVALAVGPEIDYAVARVETARGGTSETFVALVAAARVAALSEALGPEARVSVLERVPGASLLGLQFAHPFAPRLAPVIAGAHVTTDAGTGIVHTAPGHGAEDYVATRAAALLDERAPHFCPVDERGAFTDAAGEELAGLAVLGAGNDAVLARLDAARALVASRPHAHRYPMDWRTKKPVIFRATPQWFVDLAAVRGPAAAALDTITFVPSGSRARLAAMLATRTEWCISRQRFWGVPLPIFYSQRTGEPVITAETVAHVAALVAKHGTDAWFELPLAQLLPPSLAHRAGELTRGTDTMDVWLDSGLSWAAVLRARGLKYPADMYLEGSDQHRGWFQSSLLTAVALTGAAPFTTLVTNGFMLDGAGRKMSKSLGNVVDPGTIINGVAGKPSAPPHGADVLRLWVASQEYTADVRLSAEAVAATAETYRRVRNTARYLLGVLDDVQFDPVCDRARARALETATLSPLDWLALSRAAATARAATDALDALQPHRAVQALVAFVTNDLSSCYIELTKDTLYADRPDSTRRRAVQAVLAEALVVLVRALAPLAPFVAQDVFRHVPHHRAGALVATGPWLETTAQVTVPAETAQWEPLVAATRRAANVELETLRASKAIGASLDAAVTVTAGEVAAGMLGRLDACALENLCGVSQVVLTVDRALAPDAVRVVGARAQGVKCPRCWKVVAAGASSATMLCARCTNAVAALPARAGA